MAKRIRNDEQRERYNAYQREYRARNPERVRAWREAYYIRKAAKLTAQAEAQTDNGGVQDARH